MGRKKKPEPIPETPWPTSDVGPWPTTPLGPHLNDAQEAIASQLAAEIRIRADQLIVAVRNLLLAGKTVTVAGNIGFELRLEVKAEADATRH